ncbi:MAG: hypothetical protein BWY51_00529 [Parcubacteria group bacterium ADurb.Bin316]|nr:MAG: hypothetical protein BWY51_00529 [Parcubacteria group bacterium ADurb.Bin316]
MPILTFADSLLFIGLNSPHPSLYQREGVMSPPLLQRGGWEELDYLRTCFRYLPV